MKIAQIISTPPFAWSTGGPARAVFELSKCLAAKNHEVTVLTTNLFHGETSESPEHASETRDGISFRHFNVAGGYIAWKYKAYFSPGLLWYLKNHIKEYDIVHLQDLISPHAVAVSFFGKMNNVPYILTAHGSIPWLCEQKFLNTLYYRLFGSRLLKNAGRIIALTLTEKMELLRLSVPEEKIVVIPNGIPLSEYGTLPEKGAFRSKYHIGDREKMILFHGRVHRIKGIDLLIDAFSDLLKDHPDLRMVIAGRDDGFSGELQRQANRLNIADRIIFTGQLTEQEKIAAYVDADVFVLPSIHEGFPLTVLEAIACGTPVVVTRGCNLSETLEDCGLVVDRDRTQLAQAIEKILGNAGLRDYFVKHGLEKIRNGFTWDIIAARIETVYHDCLKEKPE